MTRLLVTLFYYGILTPTAFLLRLAGVDLLRLRRSEASSYWIEPASDAWSADRFRRRKL